MLSREWMGTLAATLLIGLLGVAASPSPYAGFSLDDVRRPMLRGNVRTRDLKTEGEVIVKTDISVGGSEDGRAANLNPSTTPTPISESLKMVTKQLLQPPSATDMVVTDVRTPPKVKAQHRPPEVVETDFVPLGKGEALPVVMEDPSAYEIVTAPPAKQSTAPPGGISTWILLSNGEQSTLATKKKNSVAPTVDPTKKPIQKTSSSPTPEKHVKKEEGLIMKPHQNKPTTQVKKQNSTKPEPTKASPIVLQDSKFKNRTPVVVGRIPAVQNKTTDAPSKKISTTQATISSVVTTTPSPKRRPISLHPTMPTKHIPDIVPTTSLVLENSPIETIEDGSTTEQPSNTTKRTRRPTKTKKKKNKNRRKRPTKDGETAESKIQESTEAASKIENNRPISTRIYNYLAKEVMPTVSVGIVGLVLTAGLAGLFLYPFGGGIARRNYDKGTGPMSDHHMYYYNSYSPHPENEASNAQPEEKVFGQVLTSMSQTAYNPPFDSNKYTASNNKYKYDMHDYGLGNVNGYAGSDYSTLPDSVKNGDYSLQDHMKPTDYSLQDHMKTDYSVQDHMKPSDYSVQDHMKPSDYSVPDRMKPSDYSVQDHLQPSDYSVHDPVKSPDSYSSHDKVKNNEYSLPDLTKGSDYLPEASKYYSMDPVSSHYKLTDNSPQVDSYASLTEYTSYTNAASVGTNNYPSTKENKTEPIGEDKSDKSQPQFAALVASPQFTNTDFVGSVGLSGSYDAQEVRHRTGALASDHGPRSLDDKKRTKRDVHDDFSNEIDVSDDKLVKNPPTTLPSIGDPTTNGFDSSTGKDIFTTITDDGASTTIPPFSSSETTTQHSVSSTTHGSKGDFTTMATIDDSQGSGGFLGFLTRLAQLKLKLGVNLLRTTGEALQRYLNTMAKRMEAAVRTMEKKRRSYQTWSQQQRERRDIHPKHKFKKYHKQH